VPTDDDAVFIDDDRNAPAELLDRSGYLVDRALGKGSIVSE
jgi:hypothetical protein